MLFFISYLMFDVFESDQFHVFFLMLLLSMLVFQDEETEQL